MSFNSFTRENNVNNLMLNFETSFNKKLSLNNNLLKINKKKITIKCQINEPKKASFTIIIGKKVEMSKLKNTICEQLKKKNKIYANLKVNQFCLMKNYSFVQEFGNVEDTNLSDGDINTYEVDYDVKFFTAEPVALESVDITIYKEGSNIGSVYSPNRTADITVGEVYELLTRTEPYNATIGKFTYKIADTTIATISSDNKITPLKGGTTSLTLTDPYTKKSFTYNLNVYEKPNKLYFKTTQFRSGFKLNLILLLSSNLILHFN